MTAPEPKLVESRWRGLDRPLLAAAASLIALGVLMMLSSSALQARADYGDAYHYLLRQLIGLGLGLSLGAAILVAPWTMLRRGAVWAYGAVIVALMLVYVPGIGKKVYGAWRWIQIGPVNIQPSGYAKLVVILFFSDYIARNEGRLKDFFGVVLPGVSLLSPCLVLIFYEPDLGSTVIIAALSGLLLLLGGMSLRWFVPILAVGGVLGVLAVIFEPFRLRRIVSFMDPLGNASDEGYQIVQGWIALGSGGWWGSGLGTGMAQRGFLPEAHTDFISAVVGEELGAVGWIALVSLYAIIVLRGTRIATRAPDLFGNLVAMGCTVLFGLQALVNLGGLVGWLPVKGLVLPFMSYGASEVTVHGVCIALLLRIGMEGERAVVSTYVSPAGGTSTGGLAT